MFRISQRRDMFNRYNRRRVLLGLADKDLLTEEEVEKYVDGMMRQKLEDAKCGCLVVCFCDTRVFILITLFRTVHDRILQDTGKNVSHHALRKMLKERHGAASASAVNATAVMEGGGGGQGSAAEIFVKEEALSAHVHQELEQQEQQHLQIDEQQQLEYQEQQQNLQCFPPPEPHHLRLTEAEEQGNSNVTVHPNFDDGDTMLGRVQTDHC